MNEQFLFGALPEWASWIALAAVVALILWRYRKGGGRGRGGQGTDMRPRTQPARLRIDEGDSPGQGGSSATRDLSPAQIRALKPSYEPKLDGEPDPGEVVWTWVPFVENDGRGKDRPVLLIARLGDGAWAGCYLSTKEHRGFVSVGSGPWDSKGRESFLSPERVLRVTEQGMRRESSGVDRASFERAVTAVRRYHG